MISRRNFMALASGLIVPETGRSYSFVGGWNGAGSFWVNGVWRAWITDDFRADRLVPCGPRDDVSHDMGREYGIQIKLDRPREERRKPWWCGDYNQELLGLWSVSSGLTAPLHELAAWFAHDAQIGSHIVFHADTSKWKKRPYA